MRFGIEKSTASLDDQGSTVSVINKIRDYDVMKTYKQYKLRTKVKDQKEQLVEYMKHADKVMEKHKAGILVVKDDDPQLYAAFWSEYPKFDKDGSWFVVSQWTELIE